MIGIHIDSSIPDILEELQGAYKQGCNIVQFFVNANHKDKQIYTDVRDFLRDHKISSVVHISYTINCAKEWDQYSWWIQQFIDEVNLAEYIGAFACVVHLGKQLNLTIEESVNNMYSSLLYVSQHTKNIKILLETSTGQGSEIAYKLEDLGYIYRKFSKHKNKMISERFGICVDTCHIFSAGYNIANKESRIIYFDKFNELIGLNEIKLVHLNDSKVMCGMQVDRHDNFNTGYIGKEAIKILAKVFIKLGVPIILETPSIGIIDDLSFIKSLL